MSRRTILFLLGGLAVAVVLAFGVSRFASSQPDGLQKVAADEGLDRGEQAHGMAGSPMAGYETKGIDDRGTSKGVAGVVGVVVVFAVAGGVVVGSKLVRRHSAPV